MALAVIAMHVFDFEQCRGHARSPVIMLPR
jgi:hypothetical protein